MSDDVTEVEHSPAVLAALAAYEKAFAERDAAEADLHAAQQRLTDAETALREAHETAVGPHDGS